MDIIINILQPAHKRISAFLQSATGRYLQSASFGIGGVFILLLFLSQLTQPYVIVVIIPLIVAFNAAASGYGFIEKISLKKGTFFLALASLGLAIALFSEVVISLLYPWEIQEFFIHFLITLLAACSFTLIGGWLARKKSERNNSSQLLKQGGDNI